MTTRAWRKAAWAAAAVLVLLPLALLFAMA